jgi:hypothetical protein
MITRKQAKEKADSVGKIPDYIIKQIEHQIWNAAEDGKYEVFLYITDLWNSFNVHGGPTTPSKLQQNVIKFLTAAPNNFTVTFAPHGDSYVPRGLADDDNTGPEYINWGILVKFD